MLIVLNVPGAFEWLVLGWDPPDDPGDFIGLGTVAYLSAKDPGHVFIPPFKWHDAAYVKDSDVQMEMINGVYTWPRWKADRKPLVDCLEIAAGNIELEKEAQTLHLMIREWGGRVWENEVTR